MKQTTIISSGFIAIVLAVIAGVLWYKNNYHPTISSFSQCESAGYPVQQGYPKTCKAGIKSFTEPAQ